MLFRSGCCRTLGAVGYFDGIARCVKNKVQLCGLIAVGGVGIVVQVPQHITVEIIGVRRVTADTLGAHTVRIVGIGPGLAVHDRGGKLLSALICSSGSHIDGS